MQNISKRMCWKTPTKDDHIYDLDTCTEPNFEWRFSGLGQVVKTIDD